MPVMPTVFGALVVLLVIGFYLWSRSKVCELNRQAPLTNDARRARTHYLSHGAE